MAGQWDVYAICMLFESILSDDIRVLVRHLDKYVVIKNYQHGFIKGQSCVSVMDHAKFGNMFVII